jgi:8-oxo-dGTP pyrophosphatase MutT (NUDIX family)
MTPTTMPDRPPTDDRDADADARDDDDDDDAAERRLRWTVLDRTLVHDFRIFRAHRARARHPTTPHEHDFTILEGADWVNVIALTADDRVVLVRQYRAGTDRVELEIPGGLVDPGEDHGTAARRELVEETGFTASRWQHLGSTSPNPAIQGNRLHTWLALDAARSAIATPEESEALEVWTAPLAHVTAMLRDGRIGHALVVVAFAHLALAGGLVLTRPPAA